MHALTIKPRSLSREPFKKTTSYDLDSHPSTEGGRTNRSYLPGSICYYIPVGCT